MSGRIALGLALALSLAAAACERRDAAPAAEVLPGDVRVRVSGVYRDADLSPVVVLSEEDGDRQLPIWIGPAEARSIAAHLQEETPPRPNSHDLATRLIARLEGHVQRITVTDLRDGIYYARILLVADGRERSIDARPSDAIAIGLRSAAPIFVRDDVFGAAERGEDTSDQGVRGTPAFDRQVPTRSL